MMTGSDKSNMVLSKCLALWSGWLEICYTETRRASLYMAVSWCLSSLFSTVAGPLHGDLGLSKHKGELAKLSSGLGLDEAPPTNSAFIGLIIS